MTPLHDFVTSLGATIRPHPATEPAPGAAGLIVVAPDIDWHDIDTLDGAPPRTDTTAVVLVAPGLARGGFVPNVVATAGVIAPTVPAAALLDAVVACMEGAEDWRVRARSVTGAGGRVPGDVGDRVRRADGRVGDGDDDEDLTLDLLGEYRLGGTDLALSTLARARTAGGRDSVAPDARHDARRPDPPSSRRSGRGGFRLISTVIGPRGGPRDRRRDGPPRGWVGP